MQKRNRVSYPPSSSTSERPPVEFLMFQESTERVKSGRGDSGVLYIHLRSTGEDIATAMVQECDDVPVLFLICLRRTERNSRLLRSSPPWQYRGADKQKKKKKKGKRGTRTVFFTSPSIRQNPSFSSSSSSLSSSSLALRPARSAEKSLCPIRTSEGRFSREKAGDRNEERKKRNG